MKIGHPQAYQQAERLLHMRELDAALSAFARAKALGADPGECHAGRWMAHMLQGNFMPAWQESDAIRNQGTADPHRFWQGEELHGKSVILRCLHGLGDAVQFFRYVPALRSLVKRLVIEVPPALLELAPYFAGVQEVITWGSGAPLIAPSWDVQIEINELPYLFRTTEEHLPIATSYLHLPSDSRGCPEAPTAKSPLRKVGVVWASGDWKPSRSLPFELLRPVLSCADCEFWNLQGGPERRRWLELAPASHLNDADASEHSVLALAETIAQLDLIITSDTLAAHLAGALGVPGWVLLERAADWRWQHGREDSPWYPSLRLFRQDRDGDWERVITRITNEIRTVPLRHPMVACTL